MHPADITASHWAASVRPHGSSLIPMTSNAPSRRPRPADVGPGIGPYWCVQRRRPFSQAPGRYHGIPLGRLRATARIRSDPDGLNRPVAAPEARRRRPQ
ncbi:hypothetical protein NDU88_006592 [Pleurodeles waltl]|uniref:Uncharacterized protein n=1 Tax=Pleurodeles waltl TaxID=8319 RepID=A0AAV7X1Q8_PLEWA|nr:hypothetical protein NDU88_006592 [Pleurodeles waltl]